MDRSARGLGIAVLLTLAWMLPLGAWLAVRALAQTPKPDPFPPCHIFGEAPFTAPDQSCTPGAFAAKTRADVCDGRTVRPSLPAAERRAILAHYGRPGFTGSSGELDHRVPLVLGGVTDRRNIWPEDELSGQNPKDRLEFRIYRRVCFADPHPMRVRTAVLVFLGDWRPAFTYYVLGIGPAPMVIAR